MDFTTLDVRKYASPEPTVSFGPIYPVPEIPTAGAMMMIGLRWWGCWRCGKNKGN